MNKEPIGLYIFRFVMGLGLFAFMGMLYWSSLLIEQEIKQLHGDFLEMKRDIEVLSNETDQILDHISLAQFSPETKEVQSSNGKESRPHIDPSLPNLLAEDPFYATTLPNMLGEGFVPHGTLHDGELGKPENLHPFSGWRRVRLWHSRCVPSAATNLFGKFETLAPDLAIKMEERPRKDAPGKEFWIHLRDDVFWQPLKQDFFPDGPKLAQEFLKKHQVTAHDFKFYFDALMNPYNEEPGAVSRRIYLEGIDSIEIVDDLTLVVKWGAEDVKEEDGRVVQKVRYVAKFTTGGSLQPLPRFVYQYFADGSKIVEDDSDPETYRNNSVWAQNFSQHWAKNIIVGCGPYYFDGITDRQISLKRNPHHYQPLDALVMKRSTRFKNTGDAIWQDFKATELETHTLAPTQVVELEEFLNSPQYQEQVKQGKRIEQLSYITDSFAYIGWNEATPFFRTKGVRQAMTMAIDRKRIIDLYLHGMGVEVVGTFSQFSPANNPNITPWPFDIIRSRELLQEEGWYDSDGDGIIDKEIDGKRVPFRFALTYFVKAQTSKAICEYVSTALREVGIDCELNGVDVGDLSATFDGKAFDAILMAWALGSPPENPEQLWHSDGAKEPGSSNAIGFANPEVDTIIHRLLYEDDKQERIRLYHRFGEILHEEAPYTFLFTPKSTLLYREFVKNVFIPSERQDLIPGANVFEPSSSVFWLGEPD